MLRLCQASSSLLSVTLFCLKHYGLQLRMIKLSNPGPLALAILKKSSSILAPVELPILYISATRLGKVQKQEVLEIGLV